MGLEATSPGHLKKAFSLWTISASASRFVLFVLPAAPTRLSYADHNAPSADFAAVSGLSKGERKRCCKVQRNLQALSAVSHGQVRNARLCQTTANLCAIDCQIQQVHLCSADKTMLR